MNSLHNENETQWIDDNSNNNSTLTTSDSNTLTIKAGKQGTPYNIMLSTPDTSSPSTTSSYYEASITSLNGSLAIGFATPTEFKSGWGTKGMFYNGYNVTNGSAAKIIGFSSAGKIKESDVIGVLLHTVENKREVVFYHNGACLGTAFSIPSSDTVFRPCLHVGGEVTLTYHAPPSPPTTFVRASPSSDGFDGDWLIKSCFTGPELGEYKFSDEVKAVLSMKKVESGGTTQFRASIKVGNTMNTTITVTGEQEEGFTGIKCGPVMFTLMMPPPKLAEMEQFLEKSLPILSKMIVSETGALIMNGPTAEIICERMTMSYMGKEKNGEGRFAQMIAGVGDMHPKYQIVGVNNVYVQEGQE